MTAPIPAREAAKAPGHDSADQPTRSDGAGSAAFNFESYTESG